jgi:thiamine-phosphate pyrophosphorylase
MRGLALPPSREKGEAVYTDPMVRYAITDGSAGTPQASARLLENARRWAAAGIDFIQLRERTLDAGALLELATALVSALREAGAATKLLVNGRPDIAIAAGADGVHLTARPGELSPAQVRRVFAATGAIEPVVSVSCHTLAQVKRAAAAGADLILFGPVFEKRVDGAVVVEGVGLGALAEACRAAGEVQLLALGGISGENASKCTSVGAAGVAGIRLFA